MHPQSASSPAVVGHPKPPFAAMPSSRLNPNTSTAAAQHPSLSRKQPHPAAVAMASHGSLPTVMPGGPGLDPVSSSGEEEASSSGSDSDRAEQQRQRQQQAKRRKVDAPAPGMVARKAPAPAHAQSAAYVVSSGDESG
jgi:hypothetical protein